MTQLFNELKQFDGRGKRAVAGGRNACFARLDAARFGNFIADLGAWKNAARTRLGALGQLDFNYADVFIDGHFGKPVGVEAAVGLAAAKVAGANLPYKIAPVGQVVA